MGRIHRHVPRLDAYQSSDPGEIRTLTVFGAADVQFGREPIKVVHVPTGSEFVGTGSDQIKNKVSALLQLLSSQLPGMSTDDPESTPN